MVGGIKASSHGMKSMSADMFLDLPTMSAPSGEEGRMGASAQVERAGLCLRRLSGPQPGVQLCAPKFLGRTGAKIHGDRRVRCAVGPSAVGTLQEGRGNFSELKLLDVSVRQPSAPDQIVSFFTYCVV